MACSRSELMKPKICRDKTMLPKARCTGKRDESRGVEKFMLCHYYGTMEGKKDEFRGVEKFMLCKYYCTIEGTFILDRSTLKLKVRNITHKLSWDHVGSCDVCVHVGSCDVCDHIYHLWDHSKSHLS